ncbi:hypothetical protein BM221_000073 [Beauveria bassiana]|uniref:Uncharacterized protein n=1 Tax=Beauveria bassiana TaxID=176275 RepID=A0A2N6NZE4_BEABA|nr:hypothetical protein BM221_000073 [Beauveria bassiana]
MLPGKNDKNSCTPTLGSQAFTVFWMRGHPPRLWAARIASTESLLTKDFEKSRTRITLVLSTQIVKSPLGAGCSH